jgi:hypothetical protein
MTGKLRVGGLAMIAHKAPSMQQHNGKICRTLEYNAYDPDCRCAAWFIEVLHGSIATDAGIPESKGWMQAKYLIPLDGDPIDETIESRELETA